MKKPRILIVEDDLNMAKALQAKLQNSGFQTVTCYNGQEAIDTLKKKEFDAVLLDIVLPQKDGFSVLQEKRETLNDRTPVHVLTALEKSDSLERALQLGASDCMIKSKVSISDVVQSLEKQLFPSHTRSSRGS